MVADLKMVMVGRFHIGSLQEVRNTAPLDFEEDHVSRDYYTLVVLRKKEMASGPLHHFIARGLLLCTLYA